jgi:hypothetical protein
VLAHLLDLERQGRVSRWEDQWTTRPDTRPCAGFRRAPARSSLRQIVLPWFLALALALAGLGWLLWQPQDAGDPLATSLVAFERQNSLTVFSAELARWCRAMTAACSGWSVQAGRRDPRADRLHGRSGAMDRNRMRWDAATQTLSVRLPRCA